MLVLQLLPAALSLLLLAVHFLRYGRLGVVVFLVVVGGLMFLRRRWVARLVQGCLAAGVLVWVVTLAGFVAARLHAGQPFLRLAVILGTVALGTGLSLLAFRSARVRAHFRLEPGGGAVPPAAPGP